MRTLVKMNFDPDIAKEVGTDAAIIFENICYWIEKNRLNEKHFYDGDWWTYNSKRAFLGLFPWLSYDQIRRNLDKLRDNNYLKIGKYNKHAYDQTMWYALGENEALRNRKLDWAKTPNGLGRNAQPIPNSNPNGKQGGELPPKLSEFVWKHFSLKDQIKLLSSIMTIHGFSEVDATAMIGRLRKLNIKNKVETAYQWLYQDVIDGKLYANYFDYTENGGGIINEMPASFEEAQNKMQDRIEKLEQEKPGFIESKVVEVPEYDV